MSGVETLETIAQKEAESAELELARVTALDRLVEMRAKARGSVSDATRRRLTIAEESYRRANAAAGRAKADLAELTNPIPTAPGAAGRPSGSGCGPVSAREPSAGTGAEVMSYSEWEVQELIKAAAREAFAAGQAAMLDGLVAVPLTIEGRWKPDTAYAPQALVYYQGQQWLAKAQTASEPSETNALWRRVDFPGFRDTE